MPLTADQFAKAVITAGLSSAEEIKAIWGSLPADSRPRDGETFAKLLIERKKVTQFQAQELLSGSTLPLALGDYVLLARIGAGGMGQVFKAQHRHMKRLAAIKLLPPALTKDEAAIKRFQREVEAAAKLSHPNIVQTHDAGVQRGVWYLAMEYVEGCDLSALLAKNGVLSVSQVTNYIQQAAHGLAFAHAEGIIHRDIKPANLFLDKNGTIKILDLGLARIDGAAAAAQEGLTQSGMVMGTVDYMAPEQAFDTRHVDARADIYSLGCTLYRLLTGQNMYEGETLVQKLMGHQSLPIPSLAERLPEAPAELVAIFQRMVAKSPADRYQTMAEVEVALAAIPLSLAVGSAPKQPAGDSKPLPTAATVATATFAVPQPPAVDGTVPTITLASPLQGTDPVSGRSIHLARQTTTQGQSVPRSARSLARILLVAAGLGTFLLAALGVSLIIRENDGQKMARVPASEGGKGKVAGEEKPTRPTPSIPPPLAKAPFNAQEAREHQDAWAKYLGTKLVEPNSIGMQLALIPPGEFKMGSSDEDIALALKIAEETKLDAASVQRIQDEGPQHLVRITKPFRLGIHEVTMGQFRKFVEQSGYKTQAEEFGGTSDVTKADDPRITPAKMKLNWRTPGYEVGENSPVTQVSWNDAVVFCNWLSDQEQLTPSYVRESNNWALVAQPQGYRLPTEAEWEYACRAGTTTPFSFGADWKDLNKSGWSRSNAVGRSGAVGLLRANPFGLYDMHGNVWEWCHDWHDKNWYERSPADDPRGPVGPSYKLSRGGGWPFSSVQCRSSNRDFLLPAYRGDSRGFRVALSGEAIN